MHAAAVEKSQTLKKAPFRLFRALPIAITLTLMASPARPITAQDVLEKMTEKERFGYVTGLVDMMSYQQVLAGNRPRAECISNAFYQKSDEIWKLIMASFSRYADKSPEGLVVVLMNRTCGTN